MKKFFACFLAVLMLVSFVACDNSADTSSGVPETTTEAPETTTEAPETTTEAPETTTEAPETTTEAPETTTEAPETTTEAPETTTEAPDTPVAEPVPMVGFILATQVYTTRFENGVDIHLEGLDSGVYSEPDRATSCGSLRDGTNVQVLEVGFEGDDITVGWAKIMVGASKWQVYIRTSQLKCFVLHEVGFPISPEQLIGQSRLVSGASDAEKAAIEASFLAYGYRTVFVEDGSTMFISNENFEDQLIQNADGGWTEFDGQGNVNRYFDSWQYELLSEYQIPTDRELPEMKLAFLGISSVEGVAIRFAPSVTLENVKAYAEKAEELGYTLGLSMVESGGVDICLLPPIRVSMSFRWLTWMARPL